MADVLKKSSSQPNDEDVKTVESTPTETQENTDEKDVQQPTTNETVEEVTPAHEVTEAKPAQKQEETLPVSSPVSDLSASSILDTTNKYKNLKQQIAIDENYHKFISLIAKLYGISISQVTNNMLKIVFDNEVLIKELKTVATKKYKAEMSIIDSKLSSI
ncbi:hypothetical protein FACS1894199_03060 [Bacteroidia bacterium]|nr:hypothetical protein FACS1894199_03060 [Bacteroidia bacterium]